MLLDAGVELGATKTPDRNSPLHEAAFRDEPAMMRGILSKIQDSSKYSLAALVDLQNQVGDLELLSSAVGSWTFRAVVWEHAAAYCSQNRKRELRDDAAGRQGEHQAQERGN